MLSQSWGSWAAFKTREKAGIALVGIGDMNENSYMVKLGWFTLQEIVSASIHWRITHWRY